MKVDSSVIPTSLGVNPSLTFSAVVERACQLLINRTALRSSSQASRVQWGCAGRPARTAHGAGATEIRHCDRPQGPLLRDSFSVAPWPRAEPAPRARSPADAEADATTHARNHPGHRAGLRSEEHTSELQSP